MVNGRITYFLVIFQAVVAENKAGAPKNSIPPKPGQPATSYDHQDSGLRCKNKCATPFSPYNGQVRFIDLGTNTSAEDNQMEAPAAKFSVLNLLTGGEEEEEEDGEGDEDASDYDEKLKDEPEEENYINFFDDDDDDDNDISGDNGEKISLNKLKEESEEGLLKQYTRHGFRMHNFVFPLLLAYKLKFFTVIPLLLGALVLLVGTTGIAGFFFALFAAALGIHVKSHEH